MKNMFVVLLLLTGASIVDANDRIEEAIQCYREAMDSPTRSERLEMFRRSARIFRNLVNELENPSASLFVNLGNAALQADDLGQAVFAYRQALALEPNDQQAKANLQFIRSRLPDWVRSDESQTISDSIFFWQRYLTRNELLNLAAAFFFATACLGALSIWLGKSYLRSLCIIPGIFWGVLVFASYWNSTRHEQQHAVVISDVVAKSADSFSAADKFSEPLPAGTEAVIEESREGWLRIQFGENSTAWIPASKAEFLKL